MNTKVEGNIGLVAAYLAFQGKVTGVDRSNPRHIKFTVQGQGLDEIELGWINGELEGDLIQYYRCLRTVKNMLYSK